MNQEDVVQYLANIISVAGADGVVSEIEGKAIESIRQEINASESDLRKALHAIAHGGHQMTPVGRFSDKVRNLEDMIFVAICDGQLSKSEKPEILSFAKAIKISQNQVSEILSEAKLRLKSQKTTMSCTSCGKDIPKESIFCPECGHRVVSS